MYILFSLLNQVCLFVLNNFTEEGIIFQVGKETKVTLSKSDASAAWHFQCQPLCRTKGPPGLIIMYTLADQPPYIPSL